ncbi:MAG: hypothetical protein EBY20_10870, partial [Alphaproteobacteria bacterium]|nr:hypothetical protein [Alphaproteobacteria bacterium]
MKLTEKEIQNLEKEIPNLADTAFRQAYFNALSSGSSVLIVENNELVEIFPDGSRKVIKKNEPDI